MTAGLSQPVTLRGPSGVDRGRPVEAYGPSMPAPKNPVIGVICAGDLKLHRDEIKAAISRGLSERPDAVWVCVEPRSDRLTHDVMLSLDIEPVVLPMNPAWQHKPDLPEVAGSAVGAEGYGDETSSRVGQISYDLRRLWRDLEMLYLCDELVVFQKASGHSPWRDRVKSGMYTDRLYLVEVPTVKGATK